MRAEKISNPHSFSYSDKPDTTKCNPVRKDLSSGPSTFSLFKSTCALKFPSLDPGKKKNQPAVFLKPPKCDSPASPKRMQKRSKVGVVSSDHGGIEDPFANFDDFEQKANNKTARSTPDSRNAR